jgi:hypothetical protein
MLKKLTWIKTHVQKTARFLHIKDKIHKQRLVAWAVCLRHLFRWAYAQLKKQ